MFIPGTLLLFICHVREVVAVDLGHDGHDLRRNTLRCSIAVDFLDFLIVAVKNCLTVLAENSFDSRNNFSSPYNFDKKRLDTLLQNSVVRLMNNLPLVLSRVKFSHNCEDGHDFLLVTLDMVLEI